jgi:protoporphyrinogen oxidase
MSDQSKRYAIVGGGMLGMMLAHRLAQAGKHVTLFEAASSLGGLASAWSLGDVVWDRHYHVTLLSDAYNRALLAELNLDREMKWVQTRTGFYVDGKQYSMSNAVEFLQFSPLNLVEKFRLGWTIFYASRVKNWKKLEKVLVADWLRHWSGKRVFEKIWLPLLRAKLGENYVKTSAAFIWATIQRLYAARRTGLKKEMFGYLPGGYARTLAAFRDQLQKEGVELRLQHAATKLERGSEGRLRIAFQNGRNETFDEVVLAMAAPIAARICPEIPEKEKALLNGIEYQGVLCASLLLKKPLSGFYVTNITDAWVPFTGVIEMSALVDAADFGGKTLVYLPKYLPSDDPTFSISDQELEDKFVSALLRMYPHLKREDVLCFRVSREKYVMALSTLGYSDHLAPMKTSMPGVWVINSAHIVNGTLNVNETLQLAEKGAKLLLSQPDTSEAAVFVNNGQNDKTICQPVA